jgi:hypothetical protein
MSKAKTKKRVAHHRGGPAVVLFGLDEAGKPRAASFPAAQAGLAIKAAERLKLHVLKVRDQAQIGLAAQLPTGQVHANGKGLVRPVRKSQFERLCAIAKVSVQSKSSGPPADKAGGNDSSDQPPAQSVRPLPRSWDEIEVGHIVVVQSSEPENGWEEATVVRRDGDMFSLRWCQPPNNKLVKRHRLNLALLYPETENTSDPVASQLGVPAGQGGEAVQPQPAKQTDARYPANWAEIDLDHLVLAKDDSPLQIWWEAIPVETEGDTFTLEWRDHRHMPRIVRQRHDLALLHPKP